MYQNQWNYLKGRPWCSLRRSLCQLREGGIMRYQISGKQIDIGEALQTHVKAELG